MLHTTVLIQQHNTNIHAPGGIRTQDPSKRASEDPRLRPHGHWDRLFFCVRGFSPFIHFFVLFKSFRPSCHFTFHITVLTTNTTQTSMPSVGFFFIFFVPVRGFSPYDPFLYCLNPFVLHVTFTFHATVLTSNTTQTSVPPTGFEPTILVSERPQTHALDRTAAGIGCYEVYCNKIGKTVKNKYFQAFQLISVQLTALTVSCVIIKIIWSK
jgi:hypothetical protein